MINMLCASNSAPTSELAVSIDPSVFSTQVSNGSYTTPKFKAVIVGGVGPYEYEWSIAPSIASASLTSTDTESTSVKTGGYNTESDGTISVTITDTGAGNAEVSASADYYILFGEPR